MPSGSNHRVTVHDNSPIKKRADNLFFELKVTTIGKLFDKIQIAKSLLRFLAWMTRVVVVTLIMG